MAKDKNKVKAPKGQTCYVKVGGGNLRWPNRIIKTGQKFFAFPEDIPDAFKDTLEECAPVAGAISVSNAKKVPVKKEKKAPVKAAYKMKKHGIVKVKGRWMYNVIGDDKKVVNQDPLGKGAATELLKSLSE